MYKPERFLCLPQTREVSPAGDGRRESRSLLLFPSLSQLSLTAPSSEGAKVRMHR